MGNSQQKENALLAIEIPAAKIRERRILNNEYRTRHINLERIMKLEALHQSLFLVHLFDIHQSFHKNGKRIIAKNMTRISSATNNNTVVRGITDEKLNTALDNCISNNSCGMIRGKPSIAMIAAFCCAFAAMAARNVKTRLRLHPPSKTSPMNGPAF